MLAASKMLKRRTLLSMMSCGGGFGVWHPLYLVSQAFAYDVNE